MNLENALARYTGYGKNITLVNRDVVLHEGNFINVIAKITNIKTAL
jgi:hypothetical protein